MGQENATLVDTVTRVKTGGVQIILRKKLKG